MDQSLPLPASPPGSAAAAGALAAQASPTPGPAADADSDSPDRSPRPDAAPGAAPMLAADPLAEGLGLVAGVAIALISLVVPLAAVIGDPAVPPPPLPTRAAF